MRSRKTVGPVAFIICVLASGCAIHRVNDKAAVPAVELNTEFEQNIGGMVPDDSWDRPWWESFNDPVLNELIQEGLDSNFDLQVFLARIEQASAVARQAGARLYPTVAMSGSYEWEEDERITAPSTGDLEESASIGGLLRWELDLWGRLSSARKARKLQLEASVQDWLDARLLLSTAISENYFEIKEQQRQLEVLQEQIEINESLLKLTSLRFGQGQSSIVDVLQQQEQLDETKARVPEVKARIGEVEYVLDTLLGKTPGSSQRQFSSKFSNLPPLPDVGVPAMLLVRRPDLRASQQRILALDHRVGEAVSEQLPTLRIGGSLNWRGDPKLGDAIRAAFADLAVPLFAAGERRAQVRLRQAELEEALARYSGNFLTAVQEVEAVLLRERKLEERLVLVERQLLTAQRLLTEARNRFSQGLTDYLPVFTALNIVQNLERQIVSSRRDILSSRVTLHRALGGPILSPDTSVADSNANEKKVTR